MNSGSKIVKFIESLEKNIQSNHNKDSIFPETIAISKKSMSLIHKIMQQMELATKSWNVTEIKSTKIFNIPKGDHYIHIIEEIKDILENNTTIGKKYSFSIGSRTFHINIVDFILSNNEERTCVKKMDIMIRKIYVWLFVCSYFSNAECSPIINIYIYLTKKMKLLPKNNAVLDTIHINTAFTTVCSKKNNEIYIYRKEEWFKVLIHESFHSFGLDFASMDDENNNKQMFSIFPIKCDLRLYETYTETWAEMINVIFVSVNSYSCNERYINMHKLKEIIEKNMYNEIIFSMFQCAKVLHHNNLKYRELYEKSNESIIKRMNYKENTNVFSYYIVKAILIYHYNDFIEWCYANNGSIRFEQNEKNIYSFIHFIKSNYKSNAFLRTMQFLENWFSQNKNKHAEKWELQTSRMSITE